MYSGQRGHVTPGYVATNYLATSTANKRYAFLCEATISGSLDQIGYYSGYNEGTATGIGRAQCYGITAEGLIDTSNPLGGATVTYTPANGNVINIITLTSSITVTAGQLFYLVIWNNSGTPGTNYFEIAYDTPLIGPHTMFSQSSDSGVNWDTTALQSGCVPMKIGGYWCGGLLKRISNSSNSSFKLYKDGSVTQREGVIFRVFTPCTPAYGQFAIIKVNPGTEITTAYMCLEIYQGATLLCTSGNSPNIAGVETSTYGGWNTMVPFAKESVVLEPGIEYRCVLRLVTAIGDTSNYFRNKLYDTHSTYRPTDISRNSGTILGGCSATVPTITTASDWTDSINVDSPVIPTIQLTGCSVDSGGIVLIED